MYFYLVYHRADYWKSNAKKYCDFCKCWITDNKPSVEFHEKGRRHQQNVEKRLKHITRNNWKHEVEQGKEEAALAKMESAALSAYKKDMAESGDLSSQLHYQQLQSEYLSSISSSSGQEGKRVWREAKSDKGPTYYWNILTNETKWEAPSEGYLSIEEAKSMEETIQSKQWKSFHTKATLNERLKEQQQKKLKEEERAKEEREKLKAFRVEEIKIPEPAPIIEERRTNPYGRWQTVQVRELEEPIPEPVVEEVNEIPTPDEMPAPEPEEKKFKEKTVESLSDTRGPITFKKRKFAGSHSRNIRSRKDSE